MAAPSLLEVAQAAADLITAGTAALAAELDGIQVSPTLVLNPTPPCIDIYPADPFAERNAYGPTSWDVVFTVRARVSTADHEGGQLLLLELMDPRSDLSVMAALLTDQTLNGTVNDSEVSVPGGFSLYQDGGPTEARWLGCEWRLRMVLA